MKGLTLLKDTHPKLINEWDFEKNTEYSWDTISTSSGHKVWWKCKDGHSWDAAVFSRTSKTEPCGCRYCCHNSPPTTNRNFATEYPELLGEWDYDKNTVDPSTVSPKSCKTFWWKCKYGHSWKTRVAHRANGHKCPRCNNKSSMLQIFIFCEIKYFFPNAEYCRKINGIECDIYLPTENIAIELDSSRWHNYKHNKDIEKVHKLQELGITIINIREYNQPFINPNTISYTNNNDQLEIAKNLAKFLGNLLNRQNLIDYSQSNMPVNDKEYFTEMSRYPFSFTKSLEDVNPVASYSKL